MSIYTSQSKHCKKCDRILDISFFSKDKSKKNGLSYTCKGCRKDYQQKYYPEYIKKYETKIKRANYARKRRITDPIYKLKCNIRKLIGNSLSNKGFKKNTKTNIILGCSYEEFITHLESKFTEGMTWENYGEWVIDHKIPLASAVTESQIIELNHYTNLQPLWWDENRQKSDKLDWNLD
jgi:hypothetical protein